MNQVYCYCCNNNDDILRSALSRITNSNLTYTQWLQSSIPIKDGGLTVRRVASLALPVFSASAAGTVSLQNAWLTDSFYETFRQTWSETFETYHPCHRCHAQTVSLGQAARSNYSGIWSLVSSRPVSGLHTLSIASWGLRLDDESVRVAVGLRLGCNVCVPPECVCGTQVDACGTHVFVCKRAAAATITTTTISCH